MIYPTEMTIVSGTTVHAADPDSDDSIQSREVRVSVTFQIEEEADVDLADLAHAKAAEVERARLAAQDRIAGLDCNRRDCGGTARLPFDADDPTLEPPEEYGACPFPDEANYLIAHGGRVASGDHARNDGHGSNGNDASVPNSNGQQVSRDGHACGVEVHAGVPRSGPSWVPPIEPEKVAEPETDWATKPQVIALQSHFRRLGLSPENQTALLRDRFGKFRPERLTRDEAVGLMRSLERGEWALSHATTH